jgi:hypothetical protein
MARKSTPSKSTFTPATPQPLTAVKITGLNAAPAPERMIRQSRRRVPDRQRPRTLIFQFEAIEAMRKIVGKWEHEVNNFDGVQRAAAT